MTTDSRVIRGGREMDELLKTLPEKLQRNILRGALRAGAAELLPIVQSKIPVNEGNLRASARITTRVQKDGKITASVKVGNFIAWYAHLVEYGTRGHVIRAKEGSLEIGGVFVGPVVSHPGSRAHPFMRPAADEGFTQAVVAVEMKTRQRLTKQGLEMPEPLPPEAPE